MNSRATFNHTRGDSSINPCPDCAVIVYLERQLAKANEHHDKYHDDNACDDFKKVEQQLEAERAKVKALRIKAYRILPDEDGEGGETWQHFATDLSQICNTEHQQQIADLIKENEELKLGSKR